MFGQILTELGKAIQDGRLKPVVIGPLGISHSGTSRSCWRWPTTTSAGRRHSGQILRDILSGAGGQVQVPRQALMNGAGAAVFGDELEAGRDVERSQIDSLQQLFNRFLGAQGR